jgi:hypothetical protein
VTEVIKTKPQPFVNRCLRYILKIRWPKKITNAELWRITGQSGVNLEIRRRKFGWLGHTLRKGYDEIPSTSLTWKREWVRPTDSGLERQN